MLILPSHVFLSLNLLFDFSALGFAHDRGCSSSKWHEQRFAWGLIEESYVYSCIILATRRKLSKVNEQNESTSSDYDGPLQGEW